MGLLRVNPAEVWDRHVKKLETIHSKMKEAEAALDDVREKRASPRIRSFYLISYIPVKEQKQQYIVSIGRTLDVSEGGANVETHRRLDKGTELELEIGVGDDIIFARGEVLYSEEVGRALFGTRIRFTSIREEDRRLLRPEVTA